VVSLWALFVAKQIMSLKDFTQNRIKPPINVFLALEKYYMSLNRFKFLNKIELTRLLLRENPKKEIYI